MPTLPSGCTKHRREKVVGEKGTLGTVLAPTVTVKGEEDSEGRTTVHWLILSYDDERLKPLSLKRADLLVAATIASLLDFVLVDFRRAGIQMQDFLGVSSLMSIGLIRLSRYDGGSTRHSLMGSDRISTLLSFLQTCFFVL
jgi:hypothetical protein